MAARTPIHNPQSTIHGPRAVFLDRDGVINVSPGEDRFVLRWEEFRFADGAEDALRKFKAAGFLLIVVTNQSCVGRGMMGEADLMEIHLRMAERLAESGAALDGLYYCPHHPDAGCACRKPQPTMVLRAAKDFGIDLSASWMIGDSARDIEMGRAAGCRTILCREMLPEVRNLPASQAPDKTARSLPEAADLIISSTNGRSLESC